MKKKTLLPFLLCGCFLHPVQAQLVNTGQVITISENGLLSLGGNYQHKAGSINDQGSMMIHGDWINHNSSSEVFDHTSNGTVVFTESSQHIGGTAKTLFPNVVLKGTGSKQLTFSIDVAGTLNLNDIELKAESHTLTVLNADAEALSRGGGFISTDKKGKLIRKTAGTGAYLFPLGSSLNGSPALYRPLTIQPEEAGANSFSAAFIPGDPTYEGFDRSRKRQDLNRIFDKYFYILCQQNDAKANIRFQVNTKEDGSFTQLASWNQYNLWEKAAGTEPKAITGQSLSLSYAAIRSFQNVPFTFADIQSADPLSSDPLTIFNAFSPDGDGKNDTWIIKNIDLYPQNTLTIFNRWGDEVYRAQGYSNSKAWDGGSLNPGTYYYVLQVQVNGQSKTYKGFITMIKKE